MAYIGNSPALDETVSSSQIVDLTVDTADIAADAITGAKIADDAIDSEHYANVSIDNAHVATGLDAVKLADGSVTNTEFQYINTLSSNAQTQISAALPKAGGAMTGAITTNSTFDGIDIATRDAILSSTTTTAGAALPKAGGTMTGNIVMGDDTSIGISDSDERIEFDGAGDISLLGCNVGIGTTAPDGTLHVHTASAGTVDAHADADNLVVEGTGEVGISVLCPADSTGCLFFGSPTYSTDAGVLYSHTDRTMYFKVAGATRATIDGDGNVGIGTASPSKKLTIEDSRDNVVMSITNAHADTAYGIVIDHSNDSSNDTSSPFMYGFDGGNTERFAIWNNGQFGSSANSYGAMSDVKLKQDIVDASSQWDDVKFLASKVRKFRFKNDVEEGSSDNWMIGFVAQEIEGTCPNLVYETPDHEKNEDGEYLKSGTTTKGLKYSIAQMKAFKALGEALDRVEQLEAKVEALENA